MNRRWRDGNPRQGRALRASGGEPHAAILAEAFPEFAGSTTVSHYVKNPPEGWPAPDDWDELPTRRRPKWKRWRLWQYLADRKGRGHAGGRPKGRRGLAYPYQGDERLALARQAIAANPGATNAELIPQLQSRRRGPTPARPGT